MDSGKRRPRKSYVDYQSVFWFRFVRVLIGLMLRYWIRGYRAYGVEHVPSSGGIFLIANHTTGMDPFLLGYAVHNRMPRGPGKVELFANPIFGYVMRKIGMFPLKQEVQDAGAVRTMLELYRAGKVVIVYPEGGRSETGEMTPFFPGFARLVVRMQALVVPAAIAGGKDLLPIGTYVPRPNSAVTVVFGEPFELSEFYGRKLTDEDAEEAAAEMQRKVADLLVVATQKRQELQSS